MNRLNTTSGSLPTGSVALRDIDAGIWGDCADLQVTDDQAQFVAPTTRYLAMCAYDDGPWHPLAVVAESTVAGFVMRAIDAEDNSFWIGGLITDRTLQRRGYGRAAVQVLIDQAAAAGHPSAALSYHPENRAARALYTSLGFVETGEMDVDEIVARLRLT